MRAVKFITPFLLLTAIVLTACDTPGTQRRLYAPTRASGPYTHALQTGSWRRGEYPAPKVEAKKEEAKKLPDLTEPAPAL